MLGVPGSTDLNFASATVAPGAHVRSLNPLYRPHGVGTVQKVRDELCKLEFNPSVFSTPPHRSINYLLKVELPGLIPPPGAG